MGRNQTFLRAWTMLAIFMLLSSLLAWSAIAAKPVLANTGPATKLGFTVQPADSTADDPINVSVAVQDSGGTTVDEGSDAVHDITLSLNASNGATIEETDLTETSNASGVASFTIHIRKPGTGYTLTATSDFLTAGTSDAFDITPGVATHLAFVDQPSDGAAGDSLSTSVELLDAHGNRATNASNSVGLAANKNSLFGTTSDTPSDGLVTFNAFNIHAADSGYTLTASSTGLTSDTSGTFDITHGTATHLTLEEDVAGPYTAASDISLEINVADQYENVVDNWVSGLTVALQGGTSGAVIEENPTSFTASGGVFHPEVHVRTPGTAYSLDLTSGSLPMISSGDFDITPGPIDHFVFDSVVDQVAGTPFDIAVTAYDHWNNVKTDYDGNDAVLSGLSRSPGCTTCGTTIPAVDPEYGSLEWHDGVGRTSVEAKAAETNVKLTITDPSATNDSDPFDVDNSLTLGGFDLGGVSSQVAGHGFTADITAYDEFGNVLDTYNDHAAHLEGLNSSPGCSTCGATINSRSATYGGPLHWSGGHTSSTVTPYDADGAAQLTITDNTISDSSTFAVDDTGTLGGFDLAGLGSQTAGAGFTVTVTAYDPYGNVDDSFTGSGASFSGLNPSLGCASCGTPLSAVGPDYGTLQWSNGVATSDPSHKVKAFKAESSSLTFGNGTFSDTSSFSVTYENTLGGLSINDVTGPKIAGSTFQVTVTAYDPYGNIKQNHSTFTFSGLAPSPGCPPPSCTPPVPVATPSYAQFSLTSGVLVETVTAKNSQAGASITVSDGSPTKSDTTNTFTVNPAGATKLLFSDSAVGFNGRPIDTKLSQPIYSVCAPPGVSPNPCAVPPAADPATPPASVGTKVLAIDQFGNRVNGVNVTITKSPGTGTLTGGSSTATAGGTPGVAPFGEATFNLLKINTLGSYTLTGSASGTTATLPTGVRILDDLEACDGISCDNVAPNNTLVKSYGQISTGSDFFDTTLHTNVILDTGIAPVGDFTSKCGAGVSPFTSGPDIRIQGSGLATTTPTTTMVVVVPKDVLKKFNIQSRNAGSFNVCLGALWIDPLHTASPWKVKGGGNAVVRDAINDPLRYWGTPADCIPNVQPTSPCVGLRTKQVADVANYLHLTVAQVGAFMKDSDVAVIIKKPWPWDGKGTLY